jgi:glutathione S-transferase
MMKLYNEANPAPNPRRVRIFLAEKGISMPFVHVPMREKAHKSAEFLLKNSLGQVPVLELDDGSTLSESIAICRYLEELHPAPALFGADAWQRAQVEMWSRRIEFALMSRLGAVWVNTHKYTAHLGTQFKDFGEASRVRAIKAMQWLNEELQAREYLANERYSMADIVALTTVDFGTFIGVEMPVELTHLHDWHARVTARPSAAA